MQTILGVGDIVWQSAIAAVVTVFTVWMTRKVNKISTVGDQTHALVNSAMGVQLKMHASVTRRLAVITKDPIDAEAASQAEKTLKEHEEKQAVADSKE